MWLEGIWKKYLRYKDFVISWCQTVLQSGWSQTYSPNQLICHLNFCYTFCQILTKSNMQQWKKVLSFILNSSVTVKKNCKFQILLTDLMERTESGSLVAKNSLLPVVLPQNARKRWRHNKNIEENKKVRRSMVSWYVDEVNKWFVNTTFTPVQSGSWGWNHWLQLYQHCCHHWGAR